MYQGWIITSPHPMSIDFFECKERLPFNKFILMNIDDWQAHVGDLEAICSRLGKEIARNKALIPRIIVSCLTGVFVVGSFGFFALYVMERGILLDQFQFGIRLIAIGCGLIVILVLFKLVSYREYCELWDFLHWQLKEEKNHE